MSEDVKARLIRLGGHFSLLSVPFSSKWTQYSLLGLFTIHLLRKLRERAMNRKIQSDYAARVEFALKGREDRIEWAREQTKFVSDEERQKIEAMDFRQLREALQLEEVTAESAVRVYYGLAIKSHEKTNCLTNIIKESLDEAKKLDELAKDPSYKKPRLFGMPISIKDSTELAGQRNTWGLAKLIDKIPKEDSYQVMVLRKDGMVPFCQTNLPTACFSYNCSNAIYGTTTNPHCSSRTSGGSSGGEGALIASGGSLVGIGSDLGGSIRIPSAYSGCCGFKPSATRTSTIQVAEPMSLQPCLLIAEGPMAREPEAIVEVMRSMWSNDFISNEDALSVPINFREDLFEEGRKYRIGYFTSNGYIDPLPGNQRVVTEAAEMLVSKGHTVVPFSLGDIPQETARGMNACTFADGGVKLKERLRNEPTTPVIASLRVFFAMPYWVKKAIGWMSKLQGDVNTAESLLFAAKSAADVQVGIDRVYGCRKRLVQKMKDERVDVLLCAPTLSPAVTHSMPTELPFTAMFTTMMWNALDFPAGVVTTSSWTEKDEADLAAYPEKGLVERGLKKGCKNSVGLPLAVQIVAPTFRDEMVLRVMVDLFEATKEKN